MGPLLLEEMTDWSLADKEAFAINILRMNEYKALELDPDGYYLCFSGGKDSVVIKHLAIKAGVKFKSHYNCVGIDPPELVKFIREYHPEVIWDRSKYGPFFRRVAKRGMPSVKMRWCCNEYKEMGGRGKARILGVRAEESPGRAKRWGLLTHIVSKKGNHGEILNPILYWDSEELWEYIKQENIHYCCLYDEGWHRLGCVGCPLARTAQRQKEFERWPKLKEGWRKACYRLWENRAGTTVRGGREWYGSIVFDSAEEMWEWWLSGLAVRQFKPLK